MSLSLGVIAGTVALDLSSLSKSAASVKNIAASVSKNVGDLGRSSEDAGKSAGGFADKLKALPGPLGTIGAKLGDVATKAKGTFGPLGHLATLAKEALGKAGGVFGALAHGAGHVLAPLGHVAHAFGPIAGGIASVAGGMAAFAVAGTAIGMVTGFLKSSVDAAEQAQQTQALLAQALRSTNDASGETVGGLSDLADGLAKTTTYSADQNEQTETMLLRFTHIGKSIFPQATMAALNMATAMGMSTARAARTLGRALDNPAQGMTALTRFGITFTKQQKAMVAQWVATGQTAKAQNYLLGIMQTKFGGAAQAVGKTFAGSLQIARNQLELAKEKIGNAIIPVLQHLMVAFAPVVSLLANALPGAIAVITPFITQFGNALTALASGGIKGAMKHTGDLQATLHQVGAFIRTGVLPVVGALAHLVMTEILPAAEQFAAWFAAHVLPALAQLAGFLVSAVLPVLDTLVKTFVANVLPAVEQVATAVLTKLLPPLERILGRVLPILNPALHLLGWLLGNVVGPALVGVITVVSGLLDGVDVITGVIAGFLGLLGKARPVLIAVGIAVGVVLSPVLALAAGIVLLVTHWKQVTAALGAFKGLLGQVAGAVGTFVGTLLGSIGGLIGSVLGWFGNLVSQVPAQIVAMGGAVLGALGTFIGHFLGAVGGFAGKAIGAIKTLVGHLIRCYINLYSTILGDMGGFIGNVLGLLGTLKDKASAAVSGLVGAILGFFGGLPAKMLTLGGNIIGGLVKGIKGAAGAVGDAIKNTVSNIPVIGGLIAKIPGFALGSANTPAGLATLAEREPEVVIGPSLANLAAGSKVIPFSQLAHTPGVAAGGGAGAHPNLAALAGATAGGLGGGTGSGAAPVTVNHYHATFTVEVTPEAADARTPTAAGTQFGQAAATAFTSAVQLELARTGNR